LDLLFTPRCVGCSREGGYLCGPCLGRVGRLANPIAQENLPAANGVLRAQERAGEFHLAIDRVAHTLESQARR